MNVLHCLTTFEFTRTGMQLGPQVTILADYLCQLQSLIAPDLCVSGVAFVFLYSVVKRY